MTDGFTVFTSPPPLSGNMRDNGDGTYDVEIVHEWETVTSSARDVYTNVSVMVDGRHIPGSPYVYRSTHQYAVAVRQGSKPYRPALKPSRRFAFVTLICNDDFVTGALVLADSLQRSGASHPLVAMVTSTKVSEESVALLRHFGVEVQLVDPVPNPFAAFKDKLEESAWEEVYTKIQAWSLTSFERVLFLDADQLVMRNIDSLFNTSLSPNGFAAAPDVAPPIFFNR